MRAHTRRHLLRSGAAVVGLGLLSSPSAAASYEGITVELDAATESDRLETVRQLSNAGSLVDVPEHVGLFYTKDSKFIVAASDPVETGAAAVNGTEMTNPAGPSAIVADTVNVNRRGPAVGYDELVENASSYHAEIARVTSDYGQIALSVDGGDGLFTGQFALGARTDGVQLVPPGEVGVWAAGLATENGTLDNQEIDATLGGALDDIRFVDTTGLSFWRATTTTLDVAVVQESGQAVGHIANQQFQTSVADSVADIQSGAFDDTAVQIEADALEARVSTAEVLETVLPCGPDAFTIGVACLPSNVDAVVHLGVLYDSVPPSEDDLLLYVALSNASQDSPVTGRHRRARIGGEVISTAEIHPDLPDGRAIVAYDVQYEGSGLSAPPDEVADLRDEAVSAIRSQIETAASPESDITNGEDSGGNSTSGDDSADEGGDATGTNSGRDASGDRGSGSDDAPTDDRRSSGGDGGSDNSGQRSSRGSIDGHSTPLATTRRAISRAGWSVLGGIILIASSITLFGGSLTTEAVRGYRQTKDRDPEYTVYHSIWLAAVASCSFGVGGILLRDSLASVSIAVSGVAAVSISAAGIYRRWAEKGPTVANVWIAIVGGGQFVVVVSLYAFLAGPPVAGVFVGLVTTALALIAYQATWAAIEGVEFVLAAIESIGTPARGPGSNGQRSGEQSHRSISESDSSELPSNIGPGGVLVAAVCIIILVMLAAAVSIEIGILVGLLCVALVLLGILYSLST